MAFSTLCLSRLFHGFSCKSQHPVLLTRHFWNNRALLGAFAIGALLLGLFMGVMELIPYIGPFIAGVPAVLLALQSGWTAALWTLLAICLVQQVEANLLSPRLLSGATRLHPLAVLLAIAFGGMAGGVVGMMAALPLVVCVRGAVRGWRE